jgi:hypothetical protein
LGSLGWIKRPPDREMDEQQDDCKQEESSQNEEQKFRLVSKENEHRNLWEGWNGASTFTLLS